MFGGCLSLAPLPESAVPHFKRRLSLMGLVWFAGLALVATAQLELDSIDGDASSAISAPENNGNARYVTQFDVARSTE